MGSCFSGAHNDGDHTRTDITICTFEEPHQKYRLGMVSNRLLGGGEGAETCFIQTSLSE